MKNIVETLKKAISEENIYINEPMSRHTSFRIGGPADVFVIPQNREELINVLDIIRNENIPYFILGNGTNVIVSDRGIRGVVIKLTAIRKISVEGEYIVSETGALLSAIANTALDNELTGFEFASGIPGTLGGAVTMNAGAYGTEIKDVIEKVEVIDENGNIYEIKNGNMKFAYRSSAIQLDNLIALKAWIHLKKGNYNDIRAKMDELNGLRKKKQPLEYPSAGSVFKRPEGYYAGKLIQDAGLQGYTIGGAQVSEKHCGFIVNKGDATAEDVINLIRCIQKTVKDRFGVDLHTEVKIIGEK
ncbi:UDP-N-acetylmuramate dehydrogenase [Thermoanaerobacterium thermosaccharolyticum]|uniref:UDP-N-acetylmuramate dehydrogenase n=1 Tax=Thermoanaerobacterium thermosaccharolyticum TaxID=1517 RepID=UPI00177B2D48|nr:UDP-N-acetylmuramate dehydrogenase [Thermoanaerobacterium thermosaccharolyticum]MBE0068516.1 UDP-N-acetylmuramate dehydrogenase [Thermoanaerobacterium thermosaccharolyticum]MBE0228531.1 UDP-N-acetylmuramate dehydrogenase [Thermoanaerobacterium thermosaccharolyticum]